MAAGYTDNCSAPTAYLISTTVDGDDCGEFTVTYFYRVYDDCDNFVECYVTHSGTDGGAGPQGNNPFPVDDAIAFQDDRELDLFVYPNPTNDEVELKFEHYKGETAELTVYNVYGKMLFTRSLTLNQANYRLSLLEEGLSSGSYFISVRTDATVIVRTVILARN